MLNKLKPKSGFSRNVLTLMTGTTIAQIIPIAISPILTRIYTPEDFGVFALYMSIVSILSIVATGRYELAIVLPKKENEALYLLILSIGLSFIFAFIVFISIFVFNDLIIAHLTNKNNLIWIYLIPLGIIFTAIYQSFSYWFNRQKMYKKLSYNIISQNIGMSIFQIFIGLTEVFKNIGLILGYIIGQMISSIIFIFYFFNGNANKNNINKKKLFIYFKKYKQYPLKNILGSFINSLASQMPIILIGIFYTPALAGFYMMAMKVLNVPMVFLGRAFSQVFYRNAVIEKEKKTLYSFVLKNTKFLALVIFIPMLILYFYGEDIFALVFGSKWIVSGEITKLLAPMIVVGFVYSAQSSIIMILDKLEYQIYFSVVLIILQTVGFIIGYYIFDSYTVSILLLSVVGFLVYSYNIYWILKNVK
jgi:O-antigen/teichoic acid export membrane protein